ncbi:MAG TPA: hypothetical protein VFR67_27010 [Pilimelia sp.]|nr:hypothetical protein [Pilimelia sp.]
MRKPRTRKFLIIPAVLALAFGGVALGQGAATADPVPGEEDRAYSAPVNGWAACDGGAQLASLSRLNDAPVSIGETANPVPLAGSSIPFFVPNGASRQVLARFDAETRLQGQTFDIPSDFIQVWVLLDGMPMSPDNDLMFTTSFGQSNATQDCRRVGPGNHVVSVVWQLVDQTAADNLIGTLDDWLLSVEING